MHILIIVFLLLGLRTGMLNPEEATPVAIAWPAVRVNGNEGVVAPRDEAAHLVWSEDPIDGYWLPGEDWLARAEDAVHREAAGIADENRRPIERGNRQYAGYVVNGERKIFINSMCADIDGWRSSGIMVMDGGPCFWSAVYNADTDAIEILIVNGQA